MDSIEVECFILALLRDFGVSGSLCERNDLELLFGLDSIEEECLIGTLFGLVVSGLLREGNSFDLLFGLLMALAYDFSISDVSNGSTTTLKSLSGKEWACSSIVHFLKRRQ